MKKTNLILPVLIAFFSFSLTTTNANTSVKDTVIKFNVYYNQNSTVFLNKNVINKNLKKISVFNKSKKIKVRLATYTNPFDTEQYDIVKLEKLNIKREKYIHNYISNELRKMGFVNSNKLSILKDTTLWEDWEGFRRVVSDSNSEDKELVLKISSMYVNSSVRSREIKYLSNFYEEELEKLTKKLNRTEIQIYITQ